MTEKTYGGKTFQLRGLKRHEVRKLRQEGFNLSSLALANADEAADKVMEIVLGDRYSETDALENSDAMEVFKDIVGLTFRGPDTKNS